MQTTSRKYSCGILCKSCAIRALPWYASAVPDPATDVPTNVELPGFLTGALRQFRLLSGSQVKAFWESIDIYPEMNFPGAFVSLDPQSIYLFA